MEESSGRDDFPAENPFQSVDMIARTSDILSKNRRESWAAEPL